MKKIYCFVNGGKGTDWQNVQALSEDGVFLAGHISSSEGWARHDIGMDSDWKHEIYKKTYPEGYELEWVDDPLNHDGVTQAYQRHLKLPAKEATQNQPSVQITVTE